MPNLPIEGEKIASAVTEELAPEITRLREFCEEEYEIVGDVIGYYTANSTAGDLIILFCEDNSNVTAIFSENTGSGLKLRKASFEANPIPKEFVTLTELPNNTFLHQIYVHSMNLGSDLSNEEYFKSLKQYASGLNILLQNNDFVLSFSSDLHRLQEILETINILLKIKQRNGGK